MCARIEEPEFTVNPVKASYSYFDALHYAVHFTFYAFKLVQNSETDLDVDNLTVDIQL